MSKTIMRSIEFHILSNFSRQIFPLDFLRFVIGLKPYVGQFETQVEIVANILIKAKTSQSVVPYWTLPAPLVAHMINFKLDSQFYAT